MRIHILSDLHLCSSHPHLIELFDHYAGKLCQSIDALYILGDFFEVWVGDDYLPDWVIKISEQLRRLSEHQIKVYFIHGNRDFLVGDDFAQRAGFQILPEYYTTHFNDLPCLLCHGDSFCIDDSAYIAFRQQVRQSQWQQNFLATSIEERVKTAQSYRQQSKEAMKQKSNHIVDVNEEAVKNTMLQYQTPLLIHGHTHRPALHTLNSGYRIVLSDWQQTGNFLEINQQSCQMFYFDQHRCWADEKVHLPFSALNTLT